MNDLDTLRRALKVPQEAGDPLDVPAIIGRGRRLRTRRRLVAVAGGVGAAAAVFGLVTGIIRLTASPATPLSPVVPAHSTLAPSHRHAVTRPAPVAATPSPAPTATSSPSASPTFPAGGASPTSTGTGPSPAFSGTGPSPTISGIGPSPTILPTHHSLGPSGAPSASPSSTG